jgi:hypothetical protein
MRLPPQERIEEGDEVDDPADVGGFESATRRYLVWLTRLFVFRFGGIMRRWPGSGIPRLAASEANSRTSKSLILIRARI